jgi:hypothetical protein
MRRAFGLGMILLLATGAARAELCPRCRKKNFIMSIGKCVECGSHTTSGAHKLCPKCSRKLGQCEHCRAKLAGGSRPQKKPDIQRLAIRRYGKWEHELFVARASSRGRVTVGKLTFDGNAVAGKAHGNRMWTPWGRLVFFEQRFRRGWMPLSYAGRPLPKGQEQAGPDPETGARVKGRYEQLRKSLDRFSLRLSCRGPQDKPFYYLKLSVPRARPYRSPFSQVAQITRKEALVIIGHLAQDGYLARAGNQANKDLKAPAGYGLFVQGPPGPELHEFLGWDLGMIRRLEALRKCLEGDAAKKMDLLLGRLSGLKAQWQAQAR